MNSLPEGIPFLSDYQSLQTTAWYTDIARFAAEFSDSNRGSLTEFRKTWVPQPMLQWSRRWEYPFVFSRLSRLSRLHNSSPGPVHIVDAGSGLTFFPFWLTEKFETARVTCLDYDQRLARGFKNLSAERGADVSFIACDMRSCGLPSESVDWLYCISVLEHTDDYESVVKEFQRILKPGGKFILTFDICPDGAADISTAKAHALLDVIAKFFDFTDGFEFHPALDSGLNDLGKILTTSWAAEQQPNSLPWMFPVLSAIKSSLRRGKLRLRLNLTCYCCELTRKPI